MTREVNTYLALFLISLAGALGASLIVHTVYSNTFIVVIGDGASYAVTQSLY